MKHDVHPRGLVSGAWRTLRAAEGDWEPRGGRVGHHLSVIVLLRLPALPAPSMRLSLACRRVDDEE
jgi:hypothetical protein